MIGKTVIGPPKVVFRVAKRVGARRLGLLGVGAAVGALVTPVRGTELRRRLVEEVAKRRAGAEPTVEDRVRQHLRDAPRTWHLTQPEVVAMPVADEPGWQIILAGSVPDTTARADLEQATRSVTGVVSVDNRLRVDSGTTQEP
jgi:osmotically-inducible protein OsmY